MASARKTAKTPAFEQALARLEAIVKDLEDGDLPLEESLRLFEEGVSLTRQCAGRLNEAQRQIEVLTRGAEGELRTSSMREPEAPSDAEPEDSSDDEGAGR